MKKKIIKTEELKLNKTLVIDEESKKIITSAERGRYSYFDYTEEIIKNIAMKDMEEVTRNEWFAIAQALFPNYLICSGLIDSFLMFEIKNQVRIDPPKYYYCNLWSFLNNDREARVNLLVEEVKDLFNKNNINYHESWNIELFDKINSIKEGKKNE